jgi:hypothetical protein
MPGDARNKKNEKQPHAKQKLKNQVFEITREFGTRPKRQVFESCSEFENRRVGIAGRGKSEATVLSALAQEALGGTTTSP